MTPIHAPRPILVDPRPDDVVAHPDSAWTSFAVNGQVAGQARGDNGRLDLVNFNRYQARLKVGVEF